MCYQAELIRVFWRANIFVATVAINEPVSTIVKLGMIGCVSLGLSRAVVPRCCSQRSAAALKRERCERSRRSLRGKEPVTRRARANTSYLPHLSNSEGRESVDWGLRLRETRHRLVGQPVPAAALRNTRPAWVQTRLSGRAEPCERPSISGASCSKSAVASP